jgi:oligosaccharide repeat unit polymerase
VREFTERKNNAREATRRNKRGEVQNTMSSLDLYLDIAVAFFLLLVVLNYRAHRSVLYPPFIFCAIWLLDLSVLRAGLIETDPVHGNTLAIVAAGAASFSIGGLLAGLAPRALLRIHLFPPKPKRAPNLLRNLLMIALLCGLPVMFYRSWTLQGGSFNFQGVSEASVEAIQNGDSQSFLLDHFVTIAIGISLLFATEKRNRQSRAVTVIAFIACILGTGRTGLLLLIAGHSAIHLLQTKQECLLSAMRLLRWPIVLFAALFIGLVFLDKNTEGMTGGITGIATRFLLSYIVGPLAAFDSVVQQPADFAMTTSRVFQFPMYLAAQLHLITNYTKPPQFDSFVFIPFQINVYTVFKFYFVELGTIGVLIVMFFVGLIHSLLYLKAERGGRFSTYLFAYSMYTVLLVIFDDHYYAIDGLLRASALGLLYFIIGSVPFRLLPARGSLGPPGLLALEQMRQRSQAEETGATSVISQR